MRVRIRGSCDPTPTPSEFTSDRPRKERACAEREAVR